MGSSEFEESPLQEVSKPWYQRDHEESQWCDTWQIVDHIQRKKIVD